MTSTGPRAHLIHLILGAVAIGCGDSASASSPVRNAPATPRVETGFPPGYDPQVHSDCPPEESSGCARTAAADDAIFVAPDGYDSTNCGRANAGYTPQGEYWEGPCRSIEHAMERGPKVYAAGGDYKMRTAGRVTSGAAVEGGWQRRLVCQSYSGRVPPPATYRWEKDCPQSSKASVTAIRASSPTAFVAEDIGGSAELVDLRVETNVGSQLPGTSAIAIRAAGSSTTLRLADVRIIAGRGRDGEAGAEGSAGATGGDDCSPSDGAAGGSPGATGGDADAGGTFSVDGYRGVAGANGSAGATDGNAGIPGAAGTCVDCVTQCGAAPACSIASSVRHCGTQGKAGCGGYAGGGGGGGGGGGSSVAVLAWAGARVVVERAELKATDGGNGGMGGAGGIGGAGGTGRSGTANPPAQCSTACALVLGACGGTTPDAGQGGLGSVGGVGSAGGPGGKGSAGASFAIVRGAGAIVELDSSTSVTHGKAGSGPGAAAGNVLVVP